MTFLPIVERELSVAARLSATYRNRMYTPLAIAGMGITKVLLTSPITSPGMAGASMFHTLSSLTLVFCVLEGVRKTADCISQEKREGTLGLLFLTDLKGYDVILGKLAAAWLASFYGLLAMLPILGWSLLLGGVTPWEVFRVGLAAISILLFSLTAGIWISVRSFSASRAMMGTFLMVLLCLAGPLLLKWNVLAPFSPACAFVNGTDAMYRLHWLAFWVSLLLAPLFCWWLLAGASARITKFREDEIAEQSAKPTPLDEARIAADIGSRAKLRTKLLTVNPIFWLAHRGATPSLMVWTLVFVAGAGLAAWSCWSDNLLTTSRLRGKDWIIIAFAALMNILLKVLLASQACRCLAEARRNASLEILLCAPLKAEDILQGQILALRRTFFRPAMVLLAFEMMGLLWWFHDKLGFSSAAGSMRQTDVLDSLIFAEAAFIIYFLVDLQAVAWAGMWFGLCSRNESRATFKTVFFVILLPYLLLILYCLGGAAFVAWPVVSLVWSRLKLQEHFRSLAGQRMTSSGEVSGWMPFEVPDLSGDEPVIT
ncbi:MAG: hypothetical protein JWQ04_139 [Pedosphaera sp.]|nr:hypothetical protein [Pedosphaera sp.]